jgi:hypothetical protein
MGGAERGGDGADRDIEDGRDLPVVQVGVVAEVDDQPLSLGQRRNPRADETGLGLVTVLSRRGFVTFQRCSRRAPLLLLGGVDNSSPDPGL